MRKVRRKEHRCRWCNTGARGCGQVAFEMYVNIPQRVEISCRRRQGQVWAKFEAPAPFVAKVRPATLGFGPRRQ